MTARRFLLIGFVLVTVAVWWLSGLERSRSDPRRFFTEEQIGRADAYQSPRQWGALGTTVLGLATIGVLAFTPLGDRILRPLRGLSWPVATIGVAGIVIGISAFVRLPLSFWRGFIHEREWGFSTQSAGGWFVDWGKGLGISMAITAIAFLGLVGLVRLFPRWWPAAAALAAAVFVVVLSFLVPVVLEPVFNRFTPLPDRALAARLSDLADRAGVPVAEVLVADASRRTTRENAYVSGFGATRRLVLYDTLLDKADEDEVALVVAHELGHRKERHVELNTAIGAIGAAAVVVVLWLLFRSDAVLRAARVSGPADPRALPFILFVVAAITMITLPPANWLSRRFEERADRFAFELTGDPEVYVRTERGLALRNLSDLAPGPVAYRFLFTHPAPAERIGFAMEGTAGA